MNKQFNEENRNELAHSVAPLPFDGWFDPETIDNWLEGEKDFDQPLPQWVTWLVYWMRNSENLSKYLVGNPGALTSSQVIGQKVYSSFVRYELTSNAFLKDVLGMDRLAPACAATADVILKVAEVWDKLPENDEQQPAKYKHKELFNFIQDDLNIKTLLDYSSIDWTYLESEGLTYEGKDAIANDIVEYLGNIRDRICNPYEIAQDINAPLAEYIDNESGYARTRPSEFIIDGIDESALQDVVGEWAEKYIYNHFDDDDFKNNTNEEE